MTKTVTFRPSRIGCPSIPGTIKGIILSIKGTSDVTIHYETQMIDVTFDDTQTNELAIVQAIGKEMGLAFAVIDHKKDTPPLNPSDTCPM